MFSFILLLNLKPLYLSEIFILFFTTTDTIATIATIQLPQYNATIDHSWYHPFIHFFVFCLFCLFFCLFIILMPHSHYHASHFIAFAFVEDCLGLRRRGILTDGILSLENPPLVVPLEDDDDSILVVTSLDDVASDAIASSDSAFDLASSSVADADNDLTLSACVFLNTK